MPRFIVNFIDFPITNSKILPYVLQPPELELKPLLAHLKYVYLGEKETLSAIISAKLTEHQEKALVEALKNYMEALGWMIADKREINPSFCMYRILLKEDGSPTREAQRRLNPPMMEVVKKEFIKLLDVGMIFPISDSKWVSPT
ncbi:hypothetical protein ACS0TY_029532 [Phlomoides rotata]